MNCPTLAIGNLELAFKSYRGLTRVLHKISLSIAKGERVALVGESGSGKSVTARIILGLLQTHAGVSISGTLEFEGRNLNAMSVKERRKLRGTAMSIKKN